MTTILAARRVDPPDAIMPATASAPRINATGPDDLPPADSVSPDDRRGERLTPAPEPRLKIRPSVLIHSRMDSILSSTAKMKQLCTATLLLKYSPLAVWISYTTSLCPSSI